METQETAKERPGYNQGNTSQNHDRKYQIQAEHRSKTSWVASTTKIPIIRIKLNKSGQIIRCREDFAEEMIRERKAVRV
jgi:hypothetical protein